MAACNRRVRVEMISLLRSARWPCVAAMLMAAAPPSAVIDKPVAVSRPQALSAHDEAAYAYETARLKRLAAEDNLAVELRQAQLRRMIAEDDHALFAFWIQSVFGIILTVFVLGVVIAGVYMSYLQFKVTAAALGTQEAQQGTFKISPAGFELSSSVIGLFVLMASMFFFYIYIKEVYPIRRIAAAAAEEAKPTPPARQQSSAQ